MTLTLSVEIDFNNNGTYGGGDEDVTADLRQLSIGRGRDGNTGMPPAGKCDLVLRNNTSKYSPENAAGPLYGQLLPKRIVRVRTTAPVAATIFQGYIGDIVDDPTGARSVTIKCLDGMIPALGDSGPIWTAMTQGDTPGTAANNILNAVASAPFGVPSYGDLGTTVMDAHWADGIDALRAVQDMVDEDVGNFFARGTGVFRWEGRGYRAAQAAAAVAATYDDAQSGSGVKYSEPIQYRSGVEQVYNAAVAPFQPRATPLFYEEMKRLEGAPAVGPGETRNFTLAWDAPSNDFSFTSGNRSANSSPDASGSDLTSSFTWTITQQSATRAIVQVTNNHAFLVGYVTLLSIDAKPRDLSGGQTEMQSEDTASQTIYGERRVPFQPRYIGNPNYAQDWADYMVYEFSDPRPVITLNFIVDDDASMTDLLSRELGHKVRVRNTRMGLDREFWIEGLRYGIGVQTGPRVLTCSMTLSAKAAVKPYWLIGIAGYGEIGQNTRFFG